jgi:hypothetical protein
MADWKADKITGPELQQYLLNAAEFFPVDRIVAGLPAEFLEQMQAEVESVVIRARVPPLFFHRCWWNPPAAEKFVEYFAQRPDEHSRVWIRSIEDRLHGPGRAVMREIYVAIRNRESATAIRLLAEDQTRLTLEVLDYGTWMHMAVGEGDLELVRWLVEEAGAELDDAESEWNALSEAARGGHLELVKYLHARGAKIDVSDEERNPFFAAVSWGHVEVAEYFLECRFDARAKYPSERGMTDALSLAGDLVQQSEMAALLRASLGEYSLLEAASAGHARVVRYLLSRGAKMEVTDRERNPLFAAIREGHLEVGRLLLAQGIEVRARDAQGIESDALAYAAICEQTDFAKMITTFLERRESPGAPATQSVYLAIIEFGSRHPRLAFPDGGAGPLPFDGELEILDALRAARFSFFDLRALRSAFFGREDFALITLGVRLSILAVQRGESRIVDLALWLFALDWPRLDDWRMFICLALAEYCSQRLGAPFLPMVVERGRSASVSPYHKMCHLNYPEYSPAHRTLEAIGFRADETSGRLRFFEVAK